MSDNWIVANLENAFSTWNDKMTEIWQLLTTSPQSFKGGAIWGVISGINGGLQAIGLGLLVLFFAMSIFKSTASFRDFQRPEYALKHFILFCEMCIRDSDSTISVTLPDETSIDYANHVSYTHLDVYKRKRHNRQEKSCRIFYARKYERNDDK